MKAVKQRVSLQPKGQRQYGSKFNMTKPSNPELSDEAIDQWFILCGQETEAKRLGFIQMLKQSEVNNLLMNGTNIKLPEIDENAEVKNLDFSKRNAEYLTNIKRLHICLDLMCKMSTINTANQDDSFTTLLNAPELFRYRDEVAKHINDFESFDHNSLTAFLELPLIVQAKNYVEFYKGNNVDLSSADPTNMISHYKSMKSTIYGVTFPIFPHISDFKIGYLLFDDRIPESFKVEFGKLWKKSYDIFTTIHNTRYISPLEDLKSLLKLVIYKINEIYNKIESCGELFNVLRIVCYNMYDGLDTYYVKFIDEGSLSVVKHIFGQLFQTLSGFKSKLKIYEVAKQAKFVVNKISQGMKAQSKAANGTAEDIKKISDLEQLFTKLIDAIVENYTTTINDPSKMSGVNSIISILGLNY